jgi:hypothetical protein
MPFFPDWLRRCVIGSKQTDLGPFVWLLASPPAEPVPLLTTSSRVEEGDTELVKRVMAAYKVAMAQYQTTSSFWDKDLTTIKRDVHEALIGNDVPAAAAMLRNPAETTMFWGFDAIAKAPPGALEPHQQVLTTLNASIDWQRLYSLWLMNGLKSLAEALGARRVPYPETLPHHIGIHEAGHTTPDQILAQIDAVLGFELKIPNPFPGELGLPTQRGVVGFRTIQAIYQAWRIAQIRNGQADFKVLEIGAGLGRTAFFAAAFGIEDYTIVDIPMTNAAQGYFLGRVLGQERIGLAGEQGEASVKVRCAADVAEWSDRFDLVVNVDSWTEMSRDTADVYWRFARRATNAVLSINHEHNDFTVRDIYSGDAAVTATRYPYWMRNGYVEEYITW